MVDFIGNEKFKVSSDHTVIDVRYFLLMIQKVEDLIKELDLEIENIEKSFLDKVTEKYGKGSLNPETGVFTPEKS